MEINHQKNSIILYGKVGKLDVLIKRLAALDGHQVYDFLSKRDIALPRVLNCLALMSVINEKLKEVKKNDFPLEYIERLKYYKYFSEQMLYDLAVKLGFDEIDYYNYRYNLFKLILNNHNAFDLKDAEVMFLKNLNKGKLESFKDYFTFISSVLLENSNTFDGALIDDLKKYLPLCCDKGEILNICSKYGLEVNERLTKDELINYIAYNVGKERKITKLYLEQLNSCDESKLEGYSVRLGFPMHVDMSVDELCSYLFYYIENCEFDVCQIDNIECDMSYVPLEFSIDMDREYIIVYEEFKPIEAEVIAEPSSDEAPKSEEEAKEPSVHYDEGTEAKEPEARFDEGAESNEVSSDEDTVTQDEATKTTSPETEEVSSNEVESSDTPLDEEAQQEPSAQSIEAAKACEVETETQEVSQNEEKKIIINEYYQDKRVLKLKGNKRIVVLVSILISLGLAALGVLLYILLFR